MRQHENRKLSHIAYGKRIQGMRSEVRNVRLERAEQLGVWALPQSQVSPQQHFWTFCAGSFLMVGGHLCLVGCLAGSLVSSP